MIRRHIHRNTAMVLLLSQLLLAVAGGPLMVRCQGSSDHAAIELAHVDPCDDGGTDASSAEVTAHATPAPGSLTGDGSVPARGSFAAENCIDTALTQPPALRQEKRAARAAIPVFRAYPIAAWPELRVSTSGASGISQVCVPVFKPDSAESLARSVVLLI